MWTDLDAGTVPDRVSHSLALVLFNAFRTLSLKLDS